ncbi:MAG TPA: DedA family protein [Arsenicitalea sp.]|nr:DedA family protein [Arsenicitalea sp.]
MNQLIDLLASGIIGAISATGYVGIVVLMAIESACIPLPSEIIMPFAGYLVSTGRFTLLGVATAGAVGCNLGSTIAYAIGAWGGRPVVERWGRYVLLDSSDIDTAQRFFDRFGTVTIFVGRLLPLIRTFIALPAGFARMKMWKFQLYSFIGSWLWCLLLAYIGQALGQQWQTNPAIRTAFHLADFAMVALVVIAIAWFIYRRRIARKSRPDSGQL